MSITPWGDNWEDDFDLEFVDSFVESSVSSLQSVSQNSPTLRSALSGDLDKLQEHTENISKAFTTLLIGSINSDKFINSSYSFKSNFTKRSVLGELNKFNALTSSISFSGMTEFLKKKGMIFSASSSTGYEKRVKGVIFGADEWFKKGELSDIKAGNNLLVSGSEQMIMISPRETISNTSEKVFSKTGKHLVGKREIRGSNPCDFCRSFHSEEFAIESGSRPLAFHDFCHCRLTVK